MKRILLIPLVLFGAVAGMESMLPAQSVPSPTLTGVDAALTRLFGEFKAFSADASMQVYDRDEQQVVSSKMKFALSDGRMRMDVDMSTLKSKDLPAGAAASLKQLGMDQVVSLILPAEKSSFVIYPGLEAILKVPMKEAELKATAADFKLQREEIGRETLDGHRCIKNKVTVTDSSGVTQNALTWNATNLKEFPVQIQILDGDNLVIMRFRNMNMTAPKPELFDLPVGYSRYDSQQALMQAVMMKAMSGFGGE